jgi:hypothetical protein
MPLPVTIHGLAPARYLVSVTGLGEACHSPERTLDLAQQTSSEPVEIAVVAAGSIRGRLLTGGEPASNFAVTLFPVDSTGTTEKMLLAFPDSQSRFHFRGLRPGQYRIVAHRPPWAHWLRDIRKTIQIDVPAGSPTDIDLPVSTEAEENPGTH